MNSGEFHSHITKIVKRCQFPNAQAEERAIRDALFFGHKQSEGKEQGHKPHE